MPEATREKLFAMTTHIGPLYHLLMKTPPLSVTATRGKTLREIKKLAKRHKIPSMVSKITNGPTTSNGLVYVESEDKMALQRFERDVRGMTNYLQRFATIVPPMKAPVPEDRPIRPLGQRFVDVDGQTNFGVEMARRSLWDWWADLVKKGYLKD